MHDDAGLDFVDFYVRPHFNNSHFPDITYGSVKKRAKSIDAPVYLIDDETAISVNGKKSKVISEGKYHAFNK